MNQNSKYITAALSLMVGAVFTLSAITPTEIAARLLEVDCYTADVEYSVLMPNFSDPAEYSIKLTSETVTDSLAPCHYIIDWSLLSSTRSLDGFSAFVGDRMVRFREQSIKEYNLHDDAEVFAPGGIPSKGLQNTVQFTELIPQYIALHLQSMERDSSYHYQIAVGTEVELKGNRIIQGYETIKFQYIFDPKTFMPISVEIENNPDQMGEQSISASYRSTDISNKFNLDYAYLKAQQGQIFDRYGNNKITLENIIGNPFPEITARTIDGERFFRARGQETQRPTIIVFLNSNHLYSGDLIKQLRGATENLSREMDILWAFQDRHADEIATTIGKTEPNETVLLSATNLANECGIGSELPVVVYVNRHGIVTDFSKGINKDSLSGVIQMEE